MSELYLIMDIAPLYESVELSARHKEASYALYAAVFGVDVSTARDAIEAKIAGAVPHPSRSLALQMLGIAPERWEDFNYEHVNPEDFLSRDPALIDAFETLQKSCRPVLFTNCGRKQADRTLDAIGIRGHFVKMYTVSESHALKPSVELLQRLLSELDARPEDCMCIGPREDVDIRPAKELGIRAHLVRSRDELLDFARGSRVVAA